MIFASEFYSTEFADFNFKAFQILRVNWESFGRE